MRPDNRERGRTNAKNEGGLRHLPHWPYLECLQKDAGKLETLVDSGKGAECLEGVRVERGALFSSVNLMLCVFATCKIKK